MRGEHFFVETVLLLHYRSDICERWFTCLRNWPHWTVIIVLDLTMLMTSAGENVMDADSFVSPPLIYSSSACSCFGLSDVWPVA